MDIGWIELTWGNAKTVIELIHTMVIRQGVGNLLVYCVKVKSQENPLQF
jgi:hypothetical protein